MVLLIRHVFRTDYADGRDWELLEWCLARGATDFTVSGIVSGGRPEPLEPFDALALPYKLASEARRDLEADVRVRELWQLNVGTIAALKVAFPLGLFDYDPRPSAWFEDLTVYRRGEVLLGIITHEGEGVIRLAEEEMRELHSDGFVTHETGQWAGYEPAAV